MALKTFFHCKKHTVLLNIKTRLNKIQKTNLNRAAIVKIIQSCFTKP